jgi:short-subunit dehydrogenase
MRESIAMSLPAPHPDSIALITGASAGIGEQFARQLSGRGHRVAIVARREHRLARLVEELGGDQRATAIAADLAVPEDRDRLAARLEALGAHVEILVNNAGLGMFGAFATATGREAEVRQVRVDVEAVVDLMARYLPAMVERRRGAIINMSSSSGFQPLPYNAGYAAAKSHVLLLSEAVSAEVKEHGVTVTAVCPGPVPTEFQEVNDAQFVERLPKLTWVSAERVVSDALAAAERGKRTIVPGPPQVRASFVPNRFVPSWLALPVAKRIMRR